jgi:hypothetical protein
MNKVAPNTKEQLIYFLLNNLSLGTYDKKFLANIQVKNLINKAPLTTNQATLLNKIVERYARQLGKFDLFVSDLTALPWEITPIQSLPTYTEVFLELNDNELILRSPYKKEFLAEFIKLDTGGFWNKTEKIWTIPGSTYSLKSLVSLVEKYYPIVNYCDNIKKILDDIYNFSDCKYWDPTLVYNNSLMINAINQPLYDAIKDIPFDITLPSLARIVRYGINIDSSVSNEFYRHFSVDDVDFAKSIDYNVEFGDLSIVDKIVAINTDLVLMYFNGHGLSSYFHDIKNKLILDHQIECLFLANGQEFVQPEDKDKFIVQVTSRMYGTQPVSAAKTIHVLNSQPIELK